MKSQQLKILAQIMIATLLFTSCSKSDDAPEEPLTFEIGQEHQGGIIFYLDETNEHGLIALENDLGFAEWGCSANEVPIAQGHAVGTGKTNSQAIVDYCNEDVFAAKLCADLVQNGYADWYLPSIDELGLIYEHRELIGGFPNEDFLVYISSTEGHDGCAGLNGPACYLNNFIWDFSTTPIFEDTRRITSSKVSSHLVRPIRSF